MLKTNFLPLRRIVGELPKTVLHTDGGQALHTTGG